MITTNKPTTMATKSNHARNSGTAITVHEKEELWIMKPTDLTQKYMEMNRYEFNRWFLKEIMEKAAPPHRRGIIYQTRQIQTEHNNNEHENGNFNIAQSIETDLALSLDGTAIDDKPTDTGKGTTYCNNDIK